MWHTAFCIYTQVHSHLTWLSCTGGKAQTCSVHMLIPCLRRVDHASSQNADTQTYLVPIWLQNNLFYTEIEVVNIFLLSAHVLQSRWLVFEWEGSAICNLDTDLPGSACTCTDRQVAHGSGSMVQTRENLAAQLGLVLRDLLSADLWGREKVCRIDVESGGEISADQWYSPKVPGSPVSGAVLNVMQENHLSPKHL